MTIEDIRKLPLMLRREEVERITGLSRNTVKPVADLHQWHRVGGGVGHPLRYRTSDVLRFCGYDPETGKPAPVRLG